jgi:hypothetical protein
VHSVPLMVPQYDLNLTCPRIDLTSVPLDPIILQRGYQIPFIIQTVPQLNCFGKGAVNFTNVTWSHNATSDPYILSPNRFNASLINVSGNASYIRINQTVVINDGGVNRTFRNTFNVIVLNQTVILNIANITEDGYIYIPDG